jgi:diguanylate cyclase (GGDEF)-like protein/PAS domain S-box-containing protein/putative nucleotidyltransferase with HDIG domain
VFGLRSARGRAVLASAVLILVLAMVAIVVALRVREHQHRLLALEDTATTVATLEDTRAQLFRELAALSSLVFSDDPTLADEYREAAARLEQDLIQVRAEAAAAGKVDYVAALDDLTEQVYSFDQTASAALPLLLQGNTQTKTQLAAAVVPDIRTEVEAMVATLDQLAESQRAELTAERTTASQVTDNTIWIVIGFGGAALLIAAGIAIATIVSMVRPLASLRASARAITSGNLEARAKVFGPEEAASVARDFNEMTEALAAKTKEYIDTTNLTGDIIVRLDKDGRFAFANDGACQFFGKPREELLGTAGRPLVHPDDLEWVVQMVQETVERKEPVKGFVHRLVTPMGTRTLEWNGCPLFDEEDQYAGLQITARDVTDREEAEKALRESEERYRLLAENASDIIWTTDLSFKYTYVSPAVTRVRGYSVEEVMAGTLKESLTPASLEVAQKVLAEEMTLEKMEDKDLHRSRTVEVELNREDGSTVWAEIIVTFLRNPDGQAVGLLGVSRDISERKRAQEALSAKTEEYVAVTNLTKDIIAKVDENGRWTFLNDAACQFFGKSREELLGTRPTDLVHSDDVEATIQVVQEGRTKTEPVTGFVNRQLTPMGIRVVEWNGCSVFDEEGRYVGIQISGRDITERQQMEESVRRTERRYRTLFEEAPVMYVIVRDQEGVPIIADCNEPFLSTLGYTRAEVLERPLADFYTPRSRAELLEGGGFQRGLEGRLLGEERELLTRDGRVVRTLLRALPETDPEGLVSGTRAMYVDITERQQMEEALRESEERFRSLSASAPIGIFLTDPQGKCIYANPRLQAIAGLTLEESLGHGWTRVIHLDDRQAVLNELSNGRRRGREFSREFRIVTPAGDLHWISVHSSPLPSPQGTRTGSVGTIEDITERQQMEEGLRESEEKYRRLVQDSTDGIAIVQGIETQFANRALLKMYGTDSEEDMVGRPFTDFVSPEHRELMVERACARQRGEDVPAQYEFKALRKDGTDFDAEMSVSRITYQGRSAVQGIVRDITERKKAEQALRESEARYRLLTENTSDLIWTMDLGLRYTYMSPAITRMRGYTVEEIMDLSITETMTPASVEVARKNLAKQLALERMGQGDPSGVVKVELEMYCKDGSTMWTEMSMTWLRDSDGNPIGILGVTRDINDRKRMEEALRESEERYRLLTENASDLIWTMDLGLRYTYMSPAITRMRGYTAEEIMDAPITETMTPASVEVARKTFAERVVMERAGQLGPNDTTKVELEMYCKDGSTIWTEMNMVWLRDSDGNPIGILGVTRDISERKKAEAERERLNAELEMRAITDSLTGLYDHAHFYQRLAEEIDRSKRYKHGFAVVMMDVDDFKRFNDSRGHQMGDAMLRLVADCVRAGLRSSDIAFRYGGDEFAAILPHADSSKAKAAVNRINGHIAKKLKQADGGSATRLSLSAGVACFPDDGTTADVLVRLADAALYSAKWVARARDIMGQREDIQSLISALVSRRGEVEGPTGETIFRPEALHEQQARIVSSVASSIAVALKDAGVSQALEDPDLQVLATVGAAAEIKDRHIRGHPERTSEVAAALAEEMGLSSEQVRNIKIAGLLHDIGKITVSESILNKPGKLTKREFANIKDHPIVGATLVSQVKGFEQLIPIVRHHHERFDGKGYPDGLTGEEIPLEARIMSVVDVFDALTHERSYRTALSSAEATAELERGAGTQFDPAVLEAFLALAEARGDELTAFAPVAGGNGQPVAARAAGRRKR